MVDVHNVRAFTLEILKQASQS